MSQKESILEAIRKLPDDAGFDEAIDEIRVLKSIEMGEKAADEGHVQSHDNVRALIQSWIGR